MPEVYTRAAVDEFFSYLAQKTRALLDSVAFDSLDAGPIKNAVIGLPGQGFEDYGLTGLFDRNELANAGADPAVVMTTAILAGPGTPPNAVRANNATDGIPGEYYTVSGCDETTEVQITYEFPSNFPTYSHAKWQPFLLMRGPYAGGFTSPNHITVEVSDNGTVWSKPIDGSWETTDAAAGENPDLPGLWMPSAGQPKKPDGSAGHTFRFVRFTLQDFNFTPTYSARQYLWIAQLGLRHVSAPYARQFLNTAGAEMLGDLRLKGGLFDNDGSSGGISKVLGHDGAGPTWVDKPADGADGSDGPEGPIGPAGPKGDTGATGPAGADSTVPGPQGAPGSDGTDGADSTVPGPAGPPGADGADGATGAPGSDGADAPSEFTGLTDTPAAYGTGNEGRALVVNGAGDAVEFGVNVHIGTTAPSSTTNTVWVDTSA